MTEVPLQHPANITECPVHPPQSHGLPGVNSSGGKSPVSTCSPAMVLGRVRTPILLALMHQKVSSGTTTPPLPLQVHYRITMVYLYQTSNNINQAQWSLISEKQSRGWGTNRSPLNTSCKVQPTWNSMKLKVSYRTFGSRWYNSCAGYELVWK